MSIETLDTPQKRLKSFIDSNYRKVKDFANDSGITYTDIYKYIGSGKSVIKNEKVIKKLEELGLDIAWYWTGARTIKENQGLENATVEEAYQMTIQNMSKLSIEQIMELKRKTTEITKELLEA